MVNAPNKMYSPLPADKYGKSTNQSTGQHQQAIEGKSGFEADGVRALRALCSLRSKKKIATDRRQQTNIMDTKEKENWIQDYVEWETAVARKQVQDAEPAIQQEQENMRSAESGGLTSSEPGQMVEEMLDAIGGSLSDLASLDDEEDGEDDEDTPHGKLCEDDEPGWMMGTISKTVEQRMERIRQKHRKHDRLTQPRWGDAADSFTKWDKMYSTTEFKVPAVVKPYTYDDTANGAPTTGREIVESLDIIRGISQMPHRTSRPGSSFLKLGSGMTQSNECIVSYSPDQEPNSSLFKKAKPMESVSLYWCIFPTSSSPYRYGIWTKRWWQRVRCRLNR